MAVPNYTRETLTKSKESGSCDLQPFSDYLKSTLGLSEESIQAVIEENERTDGALKETIEGLFARMAAFIEDEKLEKERRVESVFLGAEKEKRDIFAITAKGETLQIRAIAGERTLVWYEAPALELPRKVEIIEEKSPGSSARMEMCMAIKLSVDGDYLISYRDKESLIQYENIGKVIAIASKDSPPALLVKKHKLW